VSYQYKIRAINLGILLLIFSVSSYAFEPPLEKRNFYSTKVRGIKTYDLPWINLESLAIPDQEEELVDLKQWLLEFKFNLSAWPPRYSNEKEIISLIKGWQKQKKKIEKLQPVLMATPEAAMLAATFWMYGHNLDEPMAAERAGTMLDELRQKFPQSPLPPMAQGMLLNMTGGAGVESLLTEARGKTQAPELLSLIDLALVSRCALSHKPHKTVMAFKSAYNVCKFCVEQYAYLVDQPMQIIGSRADRGVEQPYFMDTSGDKTVVGSKLYGFQASLSKEWKPEKYTQFSPKENPAGYTSFEAEPLPDSGLIHGLMFFSVVLGEKPAKEPQKFLGIFGDKSRNVQVSTINPLVKNPYLTHWYRLDTAQAVGKDDTITMIVASGIIHPKTWKASEHAELAKTESACELDLDPKGFAFYRALARITAPVEFTISYSASKGSYKEAERKMKDIVSTLKIEDHALSELFVPNQ
jgi:hypothetical protein